MKHSEFIKISVDLAKEAAHKGGFPFGAIVVRNSEIVGRSDVKPSAYNPLAHGEMTAIAQACSHLKSYDLSDCVLYTSCEACAMCTAAMKWAGIEEYYYAMDRQDAKSIGYDKEIFKDDHVELEAYKVRDSEAVDFVKDWYDRKKN